MRFERLLSKLSMTTNTFFERTFYKQSNETIITLIDLYLNCKKFYFKLGPNIAFVATKKPHNQINFLSPVTTCSKHVASRNK